MSKKRVFVTRNIPKIGIDILKKHFEVKVYSKDRVIPRQDLLKGVKWCDALLCLLTDKIDQEVIDANPNLKIISNYAVGFNNVDIKHASQKHIPVSNTPGIEISDAVAEHTIALMFSLAKRLHEAELFIREGKYIGWEPMLLLGSQLKGKILGIVGLGRIGTGVAERAGRGMGMDVLYYDVIRNKKFEKKYHAKFSAIKTILKTADVITLHVPLLPSTKHLIGRKEFALMKKTAILINTSRGPIINEKVLVKALKRKQIAGAGLDVFEYEPKIAAGLAKLNNTILTPHIASATVEAREAMAILAAKNIINVLQGKKPLALVNKDYNQ